MVAWTSTTMSNDDRRHPTGVGPDLRGALDVERDSDVPISTQIYWQLAYQIDSGRLLPGSRLPPVRELGAALRVNPNTIRAVYRRLADAGLRHQPPRRRARTSPTARRSGAAPRPSPGSCPRCCAAPPTPGFTRRRARRRDLRRRHGAQAPGPARPRPLRRVHERRRRLRRRAAGRRVPRASSRPRARSSTTCPSGSTASTTTSSRRRRSTPTRPRSWPPAACRSWRCSSARATSSWSTRSPGCRAGSRVGLVCASDARHGQHPRDALDCRARRASRSSRRIIGERPDLELDRPDRRPHPDVARGAGRGPRVAVLTPGPDPAVDLRVRPVRPRAPAPRHRARRRRRVPRRRARSDGRPSGRASFVDARVPRPARGPRALRHRRPALLGVRGDLAHHGPRRDPPAGRPAERRPRARRAPASRPARSPPSACSTRSGTS